MAVVLLKLACNENYLPVFLLLQMTLLSLAHKTDLIVNNLNQYLGRTARKYFNFVLS